MNDEIKISIEAELAGKFPKKLISLYANAPSEEEIRALMEKHARVYGSKFPKDRLEGILSKDAAPANLAAPTSPPIPSATSAPQSSGEGTYFGGPSAAARPNVSPQNSPENLGKCWPVKDSDGNVRCIVLENLNEGGMGDVYRVLDVKTGKELALKIQKSWIDLEYMVKEHEALDNMNDRNIIRGHGYFLTQGGAPAILMELVNGPDLKLLIGNTEEPTAPSKRVIRRPDSVYAGLIGYVIAQTLAYVHRQKHNHLDLKPANVLISEDGMVKLGDFGIAKDINKSKDDTDIKTFEGTLQYASQEQLLGQPTFRTDLYQLGSILYELLTGKRFAQRWTSKGMPRTASSLTSAAKTSATERGRAKLEVAIHDGEVHKVPESEIVHELLEANDHDFKAEGLYSIVAKLLQTGKLKVNGESKPDEHAGYNTTGASKVVADLVGYLERVNTEFLNIQVPDSYSPEHFLLRQLVARSGYISRRPLSSFKADFEANGELRHYLPLLENAVNA